MHQLNFEKWAATVIKLGFDDVIVDLLPRYILELLLIRFLVRSQVQHNYTSND